MSSPRQSAGWLGPACNALATDVAKGDARDNPYFRDCTDTNPDFRLGGLDQLPGLTLDQSPAVRGLSEERRVLAVGEMGRTPKFENRRHQDGGDCWS